MYSIGEFAALCGVSCDTLRYYEKEKLLRPARSAAGRRVYSEADLAWIEFVQRLRATNMPIREIARYSELREAGDATMKERPAMLRTHEKKLQEELQRKQRHLDALKEKITWYEKRLTENVQDWQSRTAVLPHGPGSAVKKRRTNCVETDRSRH